ncbi:MAG: hypothetical protein WDW38_003537 [Sanguina aurantia]
MAAPERGGDQAVATSEGQQRHSFASGAHVTLQDIARDPNVRIPEADEYVIVNDHYIGTPDPSKYLQGTNFLSEVELKQEIEDGNLLPIKEYEQMRDAALKTLSPEELLYLRRRVEHEHLKNEQFVDVGDGLKVSAWDLYQYVHHNPELKALAALRRDTPSSSDASTPSRVEEDSTQAGPSQLDAKLDWSLVGTDTVWQRRPTRWFKNLDGVPNFTIAAYVQDGAAASVLGPAYAHSGRETQQVRRCEQYLNDVARAGPLMGMTFLITAARDLPLEEVAESVHSQLQPRLARPGASPEERSRALASLAEFYSNFQPERLAASTLLLDRSLAKVRQGSTLVITTGDQGRMLFQAYTPGSVGEQECYLLGSMHDSSVCTALTELFVGHGKGCLTPGLRELTAAGVLHLAHGRPLYEEPLPTYNPPVLFGKQPRFRLPFVGEPKNTMILSGVVDTVVTRHCVAAIQEATAAAASAAASQASTGTLDVGTPSVSVTEARRHAARSAFARGVSCLGICVEDLDLSSFPGLENIFGEEHSSPSVSLQVADARAGVSSPPSLQTA